LRSTGKRIDIRKTFSYEIYNKLDFKIPIGRRGDCFERYFLRVEEMRESLRIVYQCLNLLPNGLIKTTDHRVVTPTRQELKASMEAVINHFKLFSQGFVIDENKSFTVIEAPKGELGLSIITNNSAFPYRIKIKSPGFLHLQALDIMSRGHLIADVVALIGTQDIVFGEVDR